LHGTRLIAAAVPPAHRERSGGDHIHYRKPSPASNSDIVILRADRAQETKFITPTGALSRHPITLSLGYR